MTDIQTKKLLNLQLWEEVANCFADMENLKGKNEMGDNDFELSHTTAYKYLNQAINNAMIICKRRVKSPEVDLFFTCLDCRSKSSFALWFWKLRKNIQRKVFNKNISQGKKMDHSARAIEIKLITDVMAAYSMEGSYECACRKNYILCTWNGIGRPYESSLLNTDFF